MIEKEHLIYLENPRFIQWVFYPNKELNDYWEQFLADKQEEVHIINQSVQLCKMFCAEDKKLTAEEKHEILINVLNKYKRKEKRNEKLYINLLKYAAVAIVFFALGYLVFNKSHSARQQLFSESVYRSERSEDARVILSDGNNIAIENKESSVNFSEDQVIIDTDTIQAKFDELKTEIALNQVVIPYGKQSHLTLQDGSEIWLNSGSRMLFPNSFNNKKREIFLEGEAYIKVKADKTKPFIVNTNELSIEALGTEFNVCAYRTDKVVNTVLAEGLVRVRKINGLPFAKSIYLKPNQIISYNKATKQSSVNEVDINYYTSWKEGIFLFEGEELNRITKRLERYYNVEIVYENSFKGTIEIRGKLILSDDCQTALNNIASTASVEIQKVNENRYVIK